MVTDKYAPFKMAISMFTKNQPTAQSFEIWSTFKELPSLEKLEIIRYLIEDTNEVVVAVGWIVLQQELDELSKLMTSENTCTIEQMMWENITVMIEDKQVRISKASTFIEFLGRVLPYGRLDHFFDQLASYYEEGPNFATFEIHLYIRMIEATEYDHLDHRNKHEFRQSIFTKITPRVLGLFRKYQEIEDINLLATFLNFVKTLGMNTWPTVDITQIQTIFDHLLTILATCNDDAILHDTSLTLNVFMVSKPKECQDILLSDNFFDKMVSLWNVVDFDKDPELFAKTEVAMDMIMAYSQYLGKLKKPTQRMCHIAIRWLDSFKVFCVPNKRILFPLIRFLRILEQNYVGSANRLYELLQKVSLNTVFKKQEAGDFEKEFWNQINESLRFIVSSPSDNINAMGIFINFAKFIFTEEYRKTPECFGPLEGVFKTLKSSTNEHYNEVIAQISLELSQHIKLVEMNREEFDRLIFLLKIKSYVAQSYFGDVLDPLNVQHIADDIKFMFEVLDKFKPLRMNELVYAVTSFALNTVEKYGKHLEMHPQLLEEVIAELSVNVSELSCLQRVPLLEALVILDQNHYVIIEHIELLNKFGVVQDCDKMDEYLGMELGFDTQTPTPDQLTRRKEYRGVFAICKVLINHQHFKEHGNEGLIRAICTQLYVVNNWRRSQLIHPSYQTGFTKNEIVQIDWNFDLFNGHVASEMNPNSYFETMADVMFQLLETILKNEVKESISNNNLQRFLLNALPENVQITGPNFRLWLKKGFVCVAQSKLVNPKLFFHAFVNCFHQVINEYKTIEVEDDGTPLFENDEELNIKRLACHLFHLAMKCFETLMCSADNASKEVFNDLFIAQVHEPPFFDLLNELIKIKYPESAGTVGRILLHILNFCQKSSWQFPIINDRLLDSTTQLIKDQKNEPWRSSEIGYSLLVGLMSNKNQHHFISNHFETALELNLGKPQQWTQRNIKAWAKKVVNIVE